MKFFRNRLKGYALRILPDRILTAMKKAHYVRMLRTLSENDEVDFKVIKYLVNFGDHVIDIGANIGVYTKYLSKLVGQSGRIYSIEPIPLTFEILCSNIRKLGIENVELLNCAVSDANRIVIMEVPRYELGGENFYEARIVSENSGNSLRRLTLKSRTIDSLFSGNADPISFIKCDVEGHELKCLQGSMKTIRKFKPAWLVELSGNPDDLTSMAYQIMKLFGREGYKPYWFDGRNLKKRYPGNKYVNCFFLVEKHLQILRERALLILEDLNV